MNDNAGDIDDSAPLTLAQVQAAVEQLPREAAPLD